MEGKTVLVLFSETADSLSQTWSQTLSTLSSWGPVLPHALPPV